MSNMSMNMFTHWEKNPSRLKSTKLFSVKLSFDQLNKHDNCNNKQHIILRKTLIDTSKLRTLLNFF